MTLVVAGIYATAAAIRLLAAEGNRATAFWDLDGNAFSSSQEALWCFLMVVLTGLLSCFAGVWSAKWRGLKERHLLNTECRCRCGRQIAEMTCKQALEQVGRAEPVAFGNHHQVAIAEPDIVRNTRGRASRGAAQVEAVAMIRQSSVRRSTITCRKLHSLVQPPASANPCINDVGVSSV